MRKKRKEKEIRILQTEISPPEVAIWHSSYKTGVYVGIEFS